MLLTGTAAAADRMLLCGGPQVREMEIQKRGNVERFELVWQWRPEQSSGIPTAFLPKMATVDDCKPSADGKEILVSSSNGGIAIVSYPQGEALFYAAVPNAHSIAALPDGLVVAAASTTRDGNRLMLFERAHSDQPIFSLPLPGAHGVTWDDQRSVLWALGDDELLRLSVRDKTLNLDKRYPVPHGGGHDLLLSQDGRMLYVTTVSEALLFDIAGERFTPNPQLAGLRNVKSITFHPKTGRMAYTQADSRVWWTYTVHLTGPTAAIPLESETYKIRWAAARDAQSSNR